VKKQEVKNRILPEQAGDISRNIKRLRNIQSKRECAKCGRMNTKKKKDWTHCPDCGHEFGVYHWGREEQK